MSGFLDIRQRQYGESRGLDRFISHAKRIHEIPRLSKPECLESRDSKKYCILSMAILFRYGWRRFWNKIDSGPVVRSLRFQARAVLVWCCLGGVSAQLSGSNFFSSVTACESSYCQRVLHPTLKKVPVLDANVSGMNRTWKRANIPPLDFSKPPHPKRRSMKVRRFEVPFADVVSSTSLYESSTILLSISFSGVSLREQCNQAIRPRVLTWQLTLSIGQVRYRLQTTCRMAVFLAHAD
jgi:hypothetical protein